MADAARDYRSDLPTMPLRIRTLKVDARGYPVPWFVEWIDGQPDFRVISGEKLARSINLDLCWICGGPLGRWRVFPIGPMCAVNRTSAEPPSHRDCAEFSAKACPFLTRPKAKRREAGLPEEHHCAGVMIKRNPGVTLLWVVKGRAAYRVWRPDINGVLFHLHADPVECLWFSEGRAATRQEVLRSVETGLPILREEAEKESPAAVQALEKALGSAAQFYPAVAA